MMVNVVPYFGFIFGLLVGSFLNVCIYRIPIGKSIVKPRSHCPSCGGRVFWYQNLPVVSWAVLRGRCARCGEGISIRYPLVELLTGAVFFFVGTSFGLRLETPIFWTFFAALIAISFIDFDHKIIPDVISLPGILFGFLSSFFIPWLSWVDSLLGILLGGGLLFLISWAYLLLTKREGMGGGDIKLLAMIGAFLGWRAILPIVFFASFLGAVVGLFGMLVRGRDARFAIPFGPFLSLATLVFFFWGPSLIYWYLNLFR